MSPTPMNEQRASRRIVFQGLSALGVAAVLAGCGGEESQPRASDPSPADDSPSPSKPSTPKPSKQLKDSKDEKVADALATTDEIPVGGRETTVALCRCGKSRLRPFCDGTHNVIRFRAPSGAEQGRVA